ncbi:MULTISPECIES: hypothetical protein [Streptomyces]|uniref:hypothetical protein n=1 Tax=Streptomyces TaxID=1883 RepID=UPI00067C89F9|nr:MULTISPECIES: hypothetical protein [Streptomyces]
MSQPNKNTGPDGPSRSGFAETFAKGARTPKRGLAPGRRVWKTALGLPVLAGVGVGAVALATLGASQVRFGDGQEQAVAAAKQPQPTKTGAPAPAVKPSKSAGPASPTPGAPAPGGKAGPPANSPKEPEKKDTPSPDAKKPSDPPRVAGANAKVTYTGLAGPGCPTPPGGGYQEQGAYNDGGKGWYGLTGGSTREGGCSGQFTSVPMSGDANKDAKGRVMWWFAPGPESRSCQISVYVPEGPSEPDVNGHPTTYHVLTDAFNRDSKYGSFTVDQAGHRGSWQPGGTFEVRQGKIAVKLLDRGIDHGPGRDRAHHGVGPVKVTCHG